MIGLVFIGNIEYCPYFMKYKELIDSNKSDYEILFWDREGTQENYPSNYIIYKRKSKLRKSRLSKMKDFLGYRKWLKKVLKRKSYEKLIILDTLSGILLSDILLKQYQGKYIFDIRDFSYENIKPFLRLEDKIINNSYFTCISSKGFKKFLPLNYKYVNSHNLNHNEILNFQERFFKKKEKKKPLNLVWIGTVRYFEHQSKILNSLKNDERFNIIYHGSGPDLETLKDFVKRNRIKNVVFTGKYNNADKSLLLSDADILNNSYDPEIGEEVKYAISNKYYDGINFKIPQLVEVNSYKHKKVEKIGVGIGLDVNKENFANILYDYYSSIDEYKFTKNCNVELESVLDEDKSYRNKIKEFIKL